MKKNQETNVARKVQRKNNRIYF